MKEQLLELIVCPNCHRCLFHNIFKSNGPEIYEGILTCMCGYWYPVICGVPRMLTGKMRGDYTHFLSRNESNIRKINVDILKIESNAALPKSKKRTSESFGLEWRKFAQFGWEGYEDFEKNMDVASYKSHVQECLMSHTYATFFRKTLLKKHELREKRILDVGCGNGRYMYIAHLCGAKDVVGIDLSAAVEVAYDNTKEIQNIHVIQADIFNLPFEVNTFDIAYSIGVLHHTPDCRTAFNKMLKPLKNGAIVSIHLYNKGNFIWETIDYLLRFFTTRIPLTILWWILWPLTLFGKFVYLNKYTYAIINMFFRCQPVHHHNFDWYSAPQASHHIENEVMGWFNQLGIENIKCDNPVNNTDSYYLKLYPKFMINKKGTLIPFFNLIYPRWGLTIKGKKPK